MFFDSLHRECGGNYSGLRVVVIDYFAQVTNDWDMLGVEARGKEMKGLAKCEIVLSAPKPTVWQGPHRLTTRNYFAASNARNTAICLAEDGYMVCVDDLTVLVPGWLAEVRKAAKEGYVVCGSYGKVMELDVSDGEIIGFKGLTEEIKTREELSIGRRYLAAMVDGHPIGIDSRLGQIPGDDDTECEGGWAFGCSFGAPVEALLDVNGWDEDNDSMGGEDYCCGVMLRNKGYRLRYAPRMMTLESEEAHAEEEPFLRIIKGPSGPSDSSQRMYAWVALGVKKEGANYYGGRGLRDVRDRVLNGQPFPTCQIPEHDWRDGQALREM